MGGFAVTGMFWSRRILKLVAVCAVLLWASFWIISPLHDGAKFLKNVDDSVSSTFLGARGSVLLFQAIPIIVATLLSLAVIELKKILPTSTYNSSKKDGKEPKTQRRNIWRMVVFSKSPLGILNVADLVFLGLILFLVFWPFAKTTHDKFHLINSSPAYIPRWQSKFYQASIALATSGLVPFSLLWIPVSRGSPLLRFIGVPWQQAIRYHTWLAQMAIALYASHGITFMIPLIASGHGSSIFMWKTSEAALVAGFCALCVFVLMWITALPFVRRKFFEVFYFAHHLYIPAIILISLHNYQIVYYFAFPALLYFLDRLMRFVQSRQAVDVLSAKVLSSGAIELNFAKPASMTYNALSIVFVHLPGVSKLQWHPFSVTSSSLEPVQTGISICVKPVGGWTNRLQDSLKNSAAAPHAQLPGRHNNASAIGSICPFSFKASVEGPYNDESDFYLKHKALVLVAGGNGITPFLAIIRDILHRYRVQQRDEMSTLPESIDLLYVVRNPSELAILNTISPSEILLDWETRISIQVHAFVTSKVATDYPGLNGGEDLRRTFDLGSGEAWNIVQAQNYPSADLGVVFPQNATETDRKRKVISSVSGGGSSLWVCAAILATFIGFIVFWGTANLKFVHKSDPSRFKNYIVSLSYIASSALAVCVCGGLVLLAWAYIPSPKPKVDSQDSNSERDNDVEGASLGSLMWQGKLHVGQRPQWQDEFLRLEKQLEREKVGVLASGPGPLTSAVARECQRSRSSNIAFDFYSISFEL